MDDLHLAPDLALPMNVVTSVIGVLGVRGSGKTSTATVLTEEMIGANHQVVVIDPLDAWFGLRSSADGTRAGLPVIVLGGDRGDLPLEPEMALAVADLVVDEGINVVLSLRHLSKAKQRHLVAEFAERIYHRKGETKHRRPLHVVIDEADAFAPQAIRGESARTMGAIDDLVRRGRSSGFGVTLITQRAAAINKDVLTQVDLMICHRTVSPQDRKALELWIDAHDTGERKTAFLRSLASLSVGEAWVWSPGWLDLFERVKMRPRETFDSSSTPVWNAEMLDATPVVATVDLEHLRTRLATTVEIDEADSAMIEQYRRRVLTLESDLEGARRELASERERQSVIERVEVPVVQRLDEWARKEITGALETISREIDQIANALIADDISVLSESNGSVVIDGMEMPVYDFTKTITIGDQVDLQDLRQRWDDMSGRQRESLFLAEFPVPGATSAAIEPTWNALKPGQKRMLEQLARFFECGLTRVQLGYLAEVSSTSGSFSQYIKGLALASPPMIEEKHGRVWIMPDGLAHARVGVYSPDQRVKAWSAHLKTGETRMLETLVDASVDVTLTRASLGVACGVKHTSGSFSQYLRRLNELDLVHVTPAGVAVRNSPWFPVERMVGNGV